MTPPNVDTVEAAPRVGEVLGAAVLQLIRVAAMLVFVAGIGASVWLHPFDAGFGTLDDGRRLESALASGQVSSYSIGIDDDEDRSLSAAREGSGDAGAVFWRDTRGVLWQLRGTDTSRGTLAQEAHETALQRLTAAGVPRVALDRGWPLWLDRASGLAGVLAVLLLVFGPQPRRATKWAWFWMLLIPGSLGDLAWLIREAPWAVRSMAQPAPLPHELQARQPGGDPRITGGTGFLIALASSVLVGLAFWLFQQHIVY